MFKPPISISSSYEFKFGVNDPSCYYCQKMLTSKMQVTEFAFRKFFSRSAGNVAKSFDED
jgi:hypothetical protein